MCVISSACTSGEGIEISIDFDGGTAEQIIIDSARQIRFSVPPDPTVEERLWFYFHVKAADPISPVFILENAGELSQRHLDLLRPVFSSDGINWVKARQGDAYPEVTLFSKIRAKLQGRRAGFRFRSPISAKEFWVAYSYPYTADDLDRFIEEVEMDSRVSTALLGQSEQGRPIRLLSIADTDRPTTPSAREIWVVAREHAGESPGSQVLEAFVEELLSDSTKHGLLDNYRFRIVPALNVDGVANGLYYRNSNGIDLAQDWDALASVEVQQFYESMQESLATGKVALLVSMHSVNNRLGHYAVRTPEDRLPDDLAELQRNLFHELATLHPQMQVDDTSTLWEYPGIAGNYLSKNYGVYCLYVETNYSTGADDSVVTKQSLREIGAALPKALHNALSLQQDQINTADY